jgi:hypothetical protein
MTDTAFDFTTIETTESEPDFSMPDTNTALCNTPGCSNPVATYSGRGPRPKKCKDHKGKTNSSAPRKKKTYGTDYTEGVTQLISMPAAILGVVGSQTNNIPLVADAAVINHYAPKVAEAVNDLAQERPEVAAVLDRVLKAGPYAALMGAVVPMAIQILANHKILPPGMGGTMTAEQVIGIPTERREETPDAA